jgi:UDP-N-acetylmuramate dehydrogenase
LSKISELAKCLGQDRAKFDELMSRHTTLGIGGPADLYYETTDSGDLIKAVRLARNYQIPVTVIGGGSNVLVGDGGIRGLTIRNQSNKISIGESRQKDITFLTEAVASRWQSDASMGTFKYEFRDLDYEEWDEKRVSVTIDTGVNLAVAMMRLIDQGITGLQWYSRIPGTIGGAIFNNIHGGTHTIKEMVDRVVVLTKDLEVKSMNIDELEMDYDDSRFHKSGEIIIEVVFDMYLGDKDRAKAVVVEWAKRKAIQPMNSAGCVFKNITEADKERRGYPSVATGYLVEHVLKMTDFKIGGARISNAHHNFIVNDGGATAKDYLAIRDEIVKRAKKQAKINLESEIVLIGEFN